MKLPPTLKEKRHYIIVKKEAESKIKDVLMDFLGIINYARAGPKLIAIEGKIAISVERDFVHMAKTALLLSNIRVLKVSGTLKKAKA